MKVVIKINHEFFEYEINKNKKKKVSDEFNKKVDTSLLNFDTHSDYLYHKIYEELGLEKGRFFIKYKDLELFNDENLSKILNDQELCYLDVEWNDFLEKVNKIEINKNIYRIPTDVLNDSKLLKNHTDDEEIIVFNNSCLNKNFLINDWIRLSYKLKKFMADNHITKFSIPSPLIQGAFIGDKDDLLANYIGHDLNRYVSTLSLERLRDLSEAFEHLEVSDLLEITCASIAIRLINSKNLDDVKSLGII